MLSEAAVQGLATLFAGTILIDVLSGAGITQMILGNAARLALAVVQTAIGVAISLVGALVGSGLSALGNIARHNSKTALATCAAAALYFFGMPEIASSLGAVVPLIPAAIGAASLIGYCALHGRHNQGIVNNGGVQVVTGRAPGVANEQHHPANNMPQGFWQNLVQEVSNCFHHQR
jgi:hypothetical protein